MGGAEASPQSPARLTDARALDPELLQHLPLGIVVLDRNGRIVHLNREAAGLLAVQNDGLSGRDLRDALSASVFAPVADRVLRAVEARAAATDVSLPATPGAPSQVRLWVRALGDDGLALVMQDVTTELAARQRATEAMREAEILRIALDAHAIVAVTDAKGVITRVNDRFCAISRYAASELIGRTHRIINSGHHPREFFLGLWRTISRGGVWTGDICNRAKDGSLYWVHTTIVPLLGDDGRPEQYIAIRADITDRKRAEEDAVRRLSMQDAVTGLPNRRGVVDLFAAAAERARSGGTRVGVFLVDLDNFKEVNDTLGHGVGDELLRQVGARLARSSGAHGAVARLGGDEFALVVADLAADDPAARAEALSMAESLRGAIASSYLLGGQGVDITASIGIVLCEVDVGDVDEVMKQADLALYRAKAAGRNAAWLFDPALQSDLLQRAALVRDLRAALSEGQFVLYFQPVVGLDRRTLGVEALLRWPHPRGGFIPPSTFIPVAESHGLIIDLGDWVLSAACRQLVEWAADPVKSSWTIAVNVSALQMREAAFVARVEHALRASGARPDRLRLEITESMLHDDLAQTIAKMQALRAIGVRFALDDFGTGYASLSYLKRLPLDQLKIDRAFVSNVDCEANDAAIARTILALASILDIHVVAEGVETEGQWRFLVDHGCQAFQGYLLSRPLPASQL
ncbi:EAL domain-containing protein [Silanimonas algicola]